MNTKSYKPKILALKMLLMTMVVLLTQTTWAQTLPYYINNLSEYSNDEVYVGIVGITDGHVWVDAATGEVLPMDPSYNTVSGPVYDGNMGPGNNGLYADCFRKLSEIPNQTVNIPQIAGCRIMIAFESQLYLYFFGSSGDPSGYAAPNLANSTDPNQGIKYELIELTYNDNGLWCNTTRVDAYQYPMGLEVWGDGFYKKVGEVMSHDEILSEWQANAPSDFQSLINTDEGIIQFPTKTSSFPTDFYDDYIDAIWSKYASDQLVFYSGDAGTWRGTVQNDQLILTRDSDGQTGTISGKPSTEEVMEGSGLMASGGTYDLIVQAQMVAAITRHALDLDLGSGVLQDFSDESNYYQTWPYNWYSKFFHRTDISYESQTYTFAYDDVFEQSSTVHSTDPTNITITLGGFYGTDDDDDDDDSSDETGVSGLAGTYYIQNKKSGLVMDVYYGGTDDGVNILQYTNGGTENQQFTLSEVATGVYTITNVNSGKVVDVSASSTENDANIQQWTSNGSDCQKFKAISTGSGYYKFKAMHSGKIIEVADGSTEENANISQFTDNGQICGQWSLISVSGTTTYSQLIEAEDYSSMSGVEVETTTDTDGGESVGYIETGDWMAYSSISIPESGTYTVEFRVASESTGGELTLDVNAGSTVLSTVDIPVTGGWQTWETVSSTFTLDAGTYDFGIYAQSGGWNINWWKISRTSSARKASENISEETLNTSVISAYPNPTTDYINFNSTKLIGGTYSITDITGRTVLTGQYNGTSIDVSEIPSDLYIIKVINGEEKLIQKILKK